MKIYEETQHERMRESLPEFYIHPETEKTRVSSKTKRADENTGGKRYVISVVVR